MRKLLLATATLATCLFGSSAWADLLDPLHGEVCSSGAASCNTDNGSFGPIQLTGGNLNFGWSYSGPAGNNVGNLEIVVLAPVNDGFVSPSFTGTNLSMPSLANFVGTWTSGDLATFLGLQPSTPSNPFSAFQVGLDSNVTGFNVFTLDIPGILTLAQQGSPLSDFFSASGGNILSGVDLVAFLTNTPGGTIATAPSGQLQVQGLAETPIPGAVFMFGPVLLGGWYWLRRRAKRMAQLLLPKPEAQLIAA